MVADRPVTQRSRARGIDGNHASYGGDVGIVRDRFQPTPHRRQLRIEEVEHDARLNDDVVRLDRDDSAKMATEIDHQPGTQRSAPCIRPGPSGMHGNPVFRRVSDDGHYIVLAPRDDHPQRIDLVNTRVMSVRCTIEGLEIEFPLDDAPQIVINPSTSLVHGGGITSASRSPYRVGRIVKAWHRRKGEDRDSI